MEENVLNVDPSINLKQCLLWQYVNSPALRTLIESKQEWYQNNHTAFWQGWYDNVFNINTANDFGLAVWGQILKFPRNITAKDGSLHYLTTEQYRMVLKGQMYKFGMGATAPEINKWLSIVFEGKSDIFCIDTYDMSAIPFVLRANPSDEMGWLLGNIDFFPRPAGVGYEVRVIPNTIFGFNGSGLQPFNQGVFSNDYSDVLTPTSGVYQLSINAPKGSTVLINGAQSKYAQLSSGSSFTWSVSQSGYISVSGNGTLDNDISLSISSFVINDTTGEGSVFINNQQATGAFFETGTPFSYSYNVGKDGYVSCSGSGTITSDFQVDISRLKIIASPANATIYINGEQATGAFFETGNGFNYSYQVSASGYDTRIGSGNIYASKEETINLAVTSFKYELNNISTQAGIGVSTINTLVAPYEGYYTLSVMGEAGKRGNNVGGSLGTSSNGGISSVRTYLQQGDEVLFKKISGRINSNTWSGAGVALYINNTLVCVSGGGGMASLGGGGYVGGRGYGGVFSENGYNISGTVEEDNSANQHYNREAFGGYSKSFQSIVQYGFGGTSYASPSYDINQVLGGSVAAGNIEIGNSGLGKISMIYEGR